MSESESSSAGKELEAAWEILAELIRAGPPGRSALTDLVQRQSPTDLSAWLYNSPIPTRLHSVVTGGVIDKLVNIAHAETVIIQPPVAEYIAPAQLPAEFGPFVGRTQATRRAVDAVRAEPLRDSRVIVIAGASGVGKTRLALNAAHSLRDDFPDGQLYLNLRGIDRPPPTDSEIVGTLLRALLPLEATIPRPLDDRVSLYRSRLAGKRLLILLDDVASARQVRALLPGSKSCAVILTTRHNLLDVQTIRTINLNVVSLKQGLRMLTAIIGKERANAEPAAARKLVILSGFLPLAISILAHRLAVNSTWTIKRLVDRITSAERPLDEFEVGDLAVRTVFRSAYSDLSDNHRRIFRALGSLRNAELAAWALSSLTGVPSEAVESCLEDLTEGNLVECTGEDVAGQLRYRLHDLLAVFAAELEVDAQTATDRALQVRTFLEDFAGRATSCAGWVSPLSAAVRRPEGWTDAVNRRGVEPQRSEPAMLWLTAEHDTLVAAVGHAQEYGFDTLACQIASTLTTYHLRRGDDDEWMMVQEQALSSAHRSGDVVLIGTCLRDLGMLHRNIGEYSASTDVLVMSAHYLDGEGSVNERLFTLNVLADVDRYRGRAIQAVDGLEQVLAAYRRIGNTFGAAYCNMDLGMAYRSVGDLDAALGCFEQSLAVIRVVGDIDLEALVMREQGIIKRRQGMLTEAADLIGGALVLTGASGGRRNYAHSLRELGLVRVAERDFGPAHLLLLEAYGIFDGLNDSFGTSHACVGLGSLARERGDFDGAVPWFERAIEIKSEIDDLQGRAYALFELGLSRLGQNRLIDAESSLSACLTDCAAVGLLDLQQIATNISFRLNGSGADASERFDFGNLPRLNREALECGLSGSWPI